MAPFPLSEKWLTSEFPHFQRVTCIEAKLKTESEVMEMVREYVDMKQLPLVVQYDPHTFSHILTRQWLQNNYKHRNWLSPLIIQYVGLTVRETNTGADVLSDVGMDMSIQEYVSRAELGRYTLYAKDATPPEEWTDEVSKMIPRELQYRGEFDLNGYLPDDLKSDNLMFYFGMGGTRTPMHVDLCATLGYNLMLDADVECFSLWFIFDPKDYDVVSALCAQSGAGSGSLETENIWVTMEELQTLRIPVYVFEQRPGDFMLLPSDAPHQVVNVGHGFTLKYSWNRITPSTLNACLRKVLPRYRRHRRPDVYHSKMSLYEIMHAVAMDRFTLHKIAHDEMQVLLTLFEDMVRQETPSEDMAAEFDDGTTELVCDHCGSLIWNYFVSHPSCYTSHDDLESRVEGIDLCLDCIVEGVHCPHPTEMKLKYRIDVKQCHKLLFWLKQRYQTCPESDVPPSTTIHAALARLHTWQSIQRPDQLLIMAERQNIRGAVTLAPLEKTYPTFDSTRPISMRNRKGVYDTATPLKCTHSEIERSRKVYSKDQGELVARFTMVVNSAKSGRMNPSEWTSTFAQFRDSLITAFAIGAPDNDASHHPILVNPLPSIEGNNGESKWNP